MNAKAKIGKDRAGAQEIAGMICEALEKLPRDEQDARLRTIRDIKIVDRRNSSKRASTRYVPNR